MSGVPPSYASGGHDSPSPEARKDLKKRRKRWRRRASQVDARCDQTWDPYTPQSKSFFYW